MNITIPSIGEAAPCTEQLWQVRLPNDAVQTFPKVSDDVAEDIAATQYRTTLAPAVATNAQLRLALIARGIFPQAIDAEIEAMTDATQRAGAMASWEPRATIERLHPLVSVLALKLNLTEADVDAIFAAAAKF